MTTKLELISVILEELSKAQHEQWVPPAPEKNVGLVLPPTLSVGGGQHISATDKLLKAVSQYSMLILENQPVLKPQFKQNEFYSVVERAFGETLCELDFDQSDDSRQCQIKLSVDEKIEDQVQRHRRSLDLTLGCHLLDGEAAYPIKIGPVTFATREQWREQAEADGRLSRTTSRRFTAAWNGKKLGKRKPSFDAINETALLETIGNCLTVCTVSSNGLSTKMLKEKALIGARIAMTAISLMWRSPSQGLKWMNLLYDGKLHGRQYVVFGQNGYAGSSSTLSQMPSGRWIDDDLVKDLKIYQLLFDQVGEALSNYLCPAEPITRPKIMNAMLLSLWWYYEACREESDHIAITKFAASMDALTGGKKANGIIRFISKHTGIEGDKPLMKDGRTPKSIIKQLYDQGRSRMIHGSSETFIHDWSDTRATAETVGRLCLVNALDWISQNPGIDDVKALST
jgi:hypothetical protein